MDRIPKWVRAIEMAAKDAFQDVVKTALPGMRLALAAVISVMTSSDTTHKFFRHQLPFIEIKITIFRVWRHIICQVIN